MKKVVTSLAVVAVLLAIVSFGSAQTPGKTGQADMMGDVSSLMNDMSGMMVKMGGMMKDMNPEKMKQMSVFMKDLSQEMMNMSNMMGSGMMSDRELEKMRVRIMKTQMKMSSMDTKK